MQLVCNVPTEVAGCSGACTRPFVRDKKYGMRTVYFIAVPSPSKLQLQHTTSTAFIPLYTL